MTVYDSYLVFLSGGKLVKAVARETDGVVFYEYEFENPLDTKLPRPKNMKATYGVELFELCVNRGKLWSIQATVRTPLHAIAY